MKWRGRNAVGVWWGKGGTLGKTWGERFRGRILEGWVMRSKG